MPDANVFELAVAARFAQTRIYAAPELALFATHTPLFTLSTPVHFVNIRKPVLATVITNGLPAPCIMILIVTQHDHDSRYLMVTTQRTSPAFDSMKKSSL
jgi:hypothetical protein